MTAIMWTGVKSAMFGAIAYLNWRATVDEDGQYSFAIAL
jgi:hypothetical protein